MKWFLKRLGRKRSCALLIVISVIACLRYTSWLASPNRVAPKRSTEETLNKQFPSPEPPIRRWVVIAGKNTSCDRLALKFVNWMILVVDGGSQQSSNSRCVTLNQSDVERIPPELLLSAKRHSRLLAAYLYAIQHGAQVILPITVPGDVSTAEPPKHTTTIGPQTGLVPTFGGIVFDVAAHFGCNGTSRGKQPSYALSYSLCRRKVAAIQTTAACSSVHTSVSSSSSPVCDAHAPPVALANERFAPVHLEDALYTIDAFWALPGMLVADSVDKYMWSLAVQRLLWLSGNQVVVQRCSTSLSETANNRLFHAATQMNEWHCSSTTIKQCILDLIASSFGRDAITLAYSHWLDALHKSGYAFPQFSHTFNDKCENVKLHAVDHSVPLSRRPLGGGVHTPITNLDSITKVYEETCHNPNITLPMNVHVNVAQPWTQFDDVLFLVIFNNPHYEVIPYIETLYRPFFPNILYCGPDMFDVNRYPNIKQFTISFVSFGSNRRGYVAGAFTQKCMMLALQMDYSVKGYLAVADDQLLVVHTLAYLKRSKVWFEKNIHVGDLNNFKECKLDRYKKYVCATNFQYAKEHWWKVYRNETLNALAELAHSRNSSKIVDACYQRLLSKNGAADRANGAFSDIYYIPSSRSQDFIKLVDIFLHHNVMVEVAVPMIIRCFAASKDVHPLLSEKWRGEIRNEPWKLIKTKNLVGKGSFHPVKWGFLSRGSAKYTSLFCTTILPFLHDRSAGRVNRKV